MMNSRRIMKYNIRLWFCFAFFLLLSCRVFTGSSEHLGTVQDINCHLNTVSDNSLHWVRLKNRQQCVQIIDDIELPLCFYHQLWSGNMTYQIKSVEQILKQNVKNPGRNLNCETFFIFTEDVKFIIKLFQNNEKHFLPFSYIYILAPSRILIPDSSIDVALGNGYNFFYVDSEIFNNKSGIRWKYKGITNLLTDLSIKINSNDKKEIQQFYGDHLLTHPLFNPKLNKNRQRFHINLFHCPPYVIVIDEKRTLFSGVEYLFVHDVTKHWNVKIEISTMFWKGVIENLINGTVDIGLCSIWMSAVHYSKFDPSSYFDFQCTTLLVPKPVSINEATFIYYSLNAAVWTFFGIQFLGMGLLLTGFTKFGIRLGIYRNLTGSRVYQSLSRSYLEIVNTVTGHSVYIFPQHISFKFIIVSWTIVCFLFDMIYSSGYVSLMTSPPLTKTIESIEDFVEQGLSWGERGSTRSTKIDQLSRGLPIYAKAAEQVVLESSEEERMRNIHSGKFVYFVKISSNKFITDLPSNTTLELPLRVMKTCMINYYSTLGFPKQSPYREYFSRKLSTYQASGIIKYWFNCMIRDNYKFIKHFFNKKQEERAPYALTLNDISGAIYILFVGIGLSSMVFLCEIIPWKRISKKYRRSKIKSKCLVAEK